ncbi:ADP-ribosylglycohydrolase family protein [Limisalsivibrio acetivorans]|uniref:ADP-ribosylglycohydrolase family protein n=1 Tax=Limisalsivibrio acetivorans TaxID=1304888 RepID=UPI0003B53D00|nr:ADP-ribosylglycohydrolase family protein [Limisalsivibrio acetivorans]
MLGAIFGDITGSIYEWDNCKSKDFRIMDEDSFFTDDTVLTIATAHALMEKIPYNEAYREFARKYPDAGYGGNFRKWAISNETNPYNSFGNGSAMRVSPVAYIHQTMGDTLNEAKKSAGVTHNHTEGIKGAQAVVAAIFMARHGESIHSIKEYTARTFGYSFDKTIDEIRPGYSFDVSCQGSVPQAMQAFFESVSFEDAVRNAVSLGGDSDTIACITGSIAEAYYGGIPQNFRTFLFSRLDPFLSNIVKMFEAAYIPQ